MVMTASGVTSKPSMKTFFKMATVPFCSKYTKQYIADGLEHDILPSYWLVNGAWRMMDEFQEAFECPTGSKMAKPAVTCKAHYFG